MQPKADVGSLAAVLRALKASTPEECANCTLFEIPGRRQRETAAMLEALSRKCAKLGGAKQTAGLKAYINTSPPAPGRILQSARWARAALGGPTDQCGFGVTVRCPAEQLRRLVAQYPEVDANCVHLKFPGQGQRDTAVYGGRAKRHPQDWRGAPAICDHRRDRACQRPRERPGGARATSQPLPGGVRKGGRACPRAPRRQNHKM